MDYATGADFRTEVQLDIYRQEERQLKKKIDKLAHRRRIIKCIVCLNQFITFNPNRKICSDECSKNKFNRYKDSRINETNLVDRDISLRKLYDRDNGICYLCEKETNYSDFYFDDENNKIADDGYPSIDHVLPLSKGGKHAWANVKLACRGCNLKKANQSLDEYKKFIYEPNPNAKRTAVYTELGTLLGIYESATKAAEIYEIPEKTVQNCARGQNMTAHGYIFRYTDES